MKPEFCKECYEYELELKEKLNAAISSLLTVITILGGVIAFYAHHYAFANDRLTVIFVVLVSLFAVALGCAVYFVLRATFGYTYDHISSGAELRDWYKQLVARFPDQQDKAEAAFQSGLTDLYLDATKKNAKNNGSKSAYLLCANQALACAVAFAVLSGIPYFVHFYQTPTPPTQVEVVKFPHQK
jgi:hypothetical protein